MADVKAAKKQCTNEDPAVTRFRQYLRINTVQPDPDYSEALIFLEGQANEIGLEYHVIQVADKRPVVVITWAGSDQTLPTLMLNSHMDVVPVYPEKWSYPPFDAFKKDNGDIVARGSQDMKSVGMQYLEAIRCLKEAGVVPLCSVHVTFVPDEEIGGALGMKLFIDTEFFKGMNIGFGLDESVTSSEEAFTVFNGERTVLWFKAVCTGSTGHGSRLLDNTAAEKLRKVIDSALDYRDGQKKKLADNPSLKLGDVTSINMNIIEGGVQTNVIPSQLSATFDARVTPTDPLDEIRAMFEGWVKGAGPDCTLEWVQENTVAPVTDTNPDTNPWWKKFLEVFDELKLKMNLQISSVATDARFLRQAGIHCIGFSPINNTPILLHDHNEFLNQSMYLRGVDIYRRLIQQLTTTNTTEKEN